MKPCSRNRKQLAWLAVDALDPRKAEDLRAHLETCEGCRRYLAEMSAVTEDLAAAQTRSSILTSESFHQRIVRKLGAESSRAIWKMIGLPFGRRLPSWRIALPAAAAAVCLTVLAMLWQPKADSPTRSRASQAPFAPASKPDLPPTFANYQMVANQSLEKLDELLTKQGNRNPLASQTYAAFKTEE
jgi:anti-sigma factor RsiW